jgi:hypothetical protein
VANLEVQRSFVTGGQQLSFTAASAEGDDFINSGREVLIIKNADSSPHTVTIVAQGNCNQGFRHDLTYTVAVSAEEECGPFNASFYSDPSGYTHLSYDAINGITVAVVAPY